ncbi:MAG: hypothetical protein ACR2RB_08970 [Gammaproteobacteria bacterium]
MSQKEAVSKINKWAGDARPWDRAQVLGFMDHKHGVDWIKGAGTYLLTKGSEKHCREQAAPHPGPTPGRCAYSPMAL